ncbi:hypothetical protein BHE74_00059268 [Ensete ventricosum]|nr:hypothetical protein BHE74_00059268 [Ensete ventricosum]
MSNSPIGANDITVDSTLKTCFSAATDNLPVSLSLLPENSLMSSWQVPDTMGKLLTHSRRVSNRIIINHTLA